LTAILGRPLDVAFEAAPGDTCTDGAGQIGYPVVMPDGKLFVLVADGTSRGSSAPISAQSRAWAIYLIIPNEARYLKIADRLTEPQDLLSSNSGQTVYFAGRHNGQDGTWSINVQSGSVMLAAAGRYEAISLSPDGRSVLALHTTEKTSSIVRVPLPKRVEPTGGGHRSLSRTRSPKRTSGARHVNTIAS